MTRSCNHQSLLRFTNITTFEWDFLFLLFLKTESSFLFLWVNLTASIVTCGRNHCYVSLFTTTFGWVLPFVLFSLKFLFFWVLKSSISVEMCTFVTWGCNHWESFYKGGNRKHPFTNKLTDSPLLPSCLLQALWFHSSLVIVRIPPPAKLAGADTGWVSCTC